MGQDAGRYYQVVTSWRLRARPEEVVAIFRDPVSLERWWLAAFLQRPDSGGDASAPRKLSVHSKGWLPYTLRFQAVVREIIPDQQCLVRVRGDFEGECRCELHADGSDVELIFDWRVTALKPVIQRLSGLLKPLFVANHRWVMRRGRESLEIELQRRRLAACGERCKASPPGPTVPYGRRYRRLRETFPLSTKLSSSE